jgi:hypothetical protein
MLKIKDYNLLVFFSVFQNILCVSQSRLHARFDLYTFLGAMDLMRKEIEALFGKSTVTTDAGTKKFTDEDVCHYYLAGKSIFHFSSPITRVKDFKS